MIEDMTISRWVPWFGSKGGLAPLIVDELCGVPRIVPKAFWSIFLGSGAVEMEMPTCSHMTANDLHKHLYNYALVVQDPKLHLEMYKRLRRIPCHEDIYLAAKAQIAKIDEGERADPLDWAVAFFLVSWIGRNGTAGMKRGSEGVAVRWSSTGGHGGVRLRSATMSIPPWNRRMRHFFFIRKDFRYLLPVEYKKKGIANQEGGVIYADPPYVRDNKSRSGRGRYEHEFEEQDHRDLAAGLARFKDGPARVVVSYYDCDLVRELYRGWTFMDVSKSKYMSNTGGADLEDDAEEKPKAPELLIINGPSYTQAAEQQDAAGLFGFAGRALTTTAAE